MNKSDSERIEAFFSRLGYQVTSEETAADILLVNACSVRQAAIDRIWGKIRLWNKLKDEKPEIITILTGCVLPQDIKSFAQKFDLVLGIEELSRWGEKIKKTRKPILSGVGGQENKKTKAASDYFKIIPKYQTRAQILVPIMTGCNNFCSYCAVPYTRGRETSRLVKDVISEIKKAVRAGCLEVTLLGQNVNSYRPKDRASFSKNNPYRHPFAALLWELNQVKGLERIFFTAAHPKDMSDEVIDALTLPKMVNYLHLPVQAGDDEVLRLMNRHYTAKDYLKLIEKIKAKKPNIALGTDIIVGFPGETKKQFLDTVKLYKTVNFDIAYLAKFSPRVGTVAAKFKDDVSLVEKKRRWLVLQKLMEQIVLKKNQQYYGRVVSVLVDSFKDGQCGGNSQEMKRVEFKGDKKLVGRIVRVKINKPLMWILRGEILKVASKK